MASHGTSPRTRAHQSDRERHPCPESASPRERRRRRIELTTELTALIGGPAGPSLLIGLLTGQRAGLFIWACAAVITLLVVLCVYRRHNPDSRLVRRRGLAAVTLAAAVALSAAGYYQASAVSAAVSCMPAGSAKTNHAASDPRTRREWPMVYNCHTPDGGLVYEFANHASAVVGNMGQDDPSWVVCWKHGSDSRVWYYTEGVNSEADPKLLAWGFIPSTVIGAPSGQHASGVAACPRAVP